MNGKGKRTSTPKTALMDQEAAINLLKEQIVFFLKTLMLCEVIFVVTGSRSYDCFSDISDWDMVLSITTPVWIAPFAIARQIVSSISRKGRVLVEKPALSIPGGI